MPKSVTSTFSVSWDGTNLDSSYKQFVRSQWFQRGWTLQELLAPKNIEFFDRDWKHIGSKSTLIPQISEGSRISQKHLLGDFRQASIAQKMSWLAHRKTEVKEDLAYCMLGIFGAEFRQRPGLHGKEFIRLQETIIESWPGRKIFDESLFAWKSDQLQSKSEP
jgi:hypothetical protein